MSCSSEWTQVLAHCSPSRIAAGAHTTFFLARSNQSLSDLDRYPEVESAEDCHICLKNEGDGADLLECEKPYHFHCLTPPLNAVPDSEWFCAECEADCDTSGDKPPEREKQSSGPAKKRGRPPKNNKLSEPEEDEEDDDDEDEDEPTVKKHRKQAKGR